jgi:hypothetical protein
MNVQLVVMEEHLLKLPMKDFVMFCITQAAPIRK